MRTIFFLLCICLSLSLQAKKRFVVAAYVSGDSLVTTETIQAKKLTHLYYTFAGVAQGKVTETANDSINLSRLLQLKEINPKLKLLIAVGGPNGSQGFSEAVATDSSRALLVASIGHYLQKYRLDGVEIHWVMAPRGMFKNAFSRNDQHHQVLLLKALRSALTTLSTQEGRKKNNRYLLCMAGSIQRQYLFHSQLHAAHVYLDYINLQSYNYKVEILNVTGVSSTLVSSHHSSLYTSGVDAWMGLCVDKTVKEYLDHTVPRKKIVVGVACYGLGWAGTYEEFNGVFQGADARVSDDLSYQNIKAKYLVNEDNQQYWDKKAKARYAYNKKTGLFLSYDDPRAIRKKTRYIHRRRLGGAVMNDYRQDDGSLLKSLRRGLRRITFPYFIF